MVGAIGIANVTLVTVMERVGEIGLRRALGASRRQVAGQFLLESTTIGLLGGIVGAALGIAVVVCVAVVKQWTPVLDLTLAFGAPLAGALVGLLAGLYPSLRAARMEPVDALRARRSALPASRGVRDLLMPAPWGPARSRFGAFASFARQAP
ncbi:ABC transporter permease [Streptomyces sp. M10(2022)]